jgi:integrase
MSEPARDQHEDVVDGITILSDPAKDALNRKQQLDYREHRRKLVRWCRNIGKDPEKAKGYADDTVRVRVGHIDRFYRFAWDHEDGYTTAVTHDHAEAYMKELAYSDKSETAKANYQKALKMLFRWRAFELGGEKWNPSLTFSTNSHGSNPREFFTMEERRRLREAVLDMDSIPHYKSVSPEQRQQWKQYLAQRLGKPVEAITPDDWAEARGWKYPSIIHASLDAGLRPCEVGQATVGWVDVENNCLRIPKDESSKNTDNWVVALRPQTGEILGNWLAERAQYPKYTDTDALWLTRESNAYSSSSLKKLLLRVCERAEIPTENRDISHYAIRHSVGSYMTREEGLEAARSQLRHKSIETTAKYDQAPVEDRIDALERMG